MLRSKLGPRLAELSFRELASSRNCYSEGRSGVQQLGDVVPGGVYAVFSDFLRNLIASVPVSEQEISVSYSSIRDDSR